MAAASTVCASCGIEPRVGARFCDACGAPVVESRDVAEYKQVTVLFADVVHSMDIAAAVGAERLREIMAALLDCSAAVVKRFGGTVDKFTGDGMMTLFGAPLALEDHAIRACLAALSIQEEAKRLAVEVQRRDGVDLQLRVGLNSGQVIAGGIGSGALGYTAIGEQVGMAQRMESLAPPGGVMLSESTARWLRTLPCWANPRCSVSRVLTSRSRRVDCLRSGSAMDLPPGSQLWWAVTWRSAPSLVCWIGRSPVAVAWSVLWDQRASVRPVLSVKRHVLRKAVTSRCSQPRANRTRRTSRSVR